MGSFDTVMLFSVIHHTENIFENCKKIASSAHRILIECRCNEGGAKPLFNGEWIRTTIWKYENIDEMREGLERLFPGFNATQVFGPGDRERYIIELTRTNWYGKNTKNPTLLHYIAVLSNNDLSASLRPDSTKEAISRTLEWITSMFFWSIDSSFLDYLFTFYSSLYF